MLDQSVAYEEHALRELRNSGFRITMPRIQVIRALSETDVALSAYAIHEIIVKSGGRIDVVSVYRILATLEEVGLIHRIGIVNGYYPNRLADPQARRTMVLVNQEDGTVREIAATDGVMTAIESVLKNAGFDASQVKVEILGTPKK